MVSRQEWQYQRFVSSLFVIVLAGALSMSVSPVQIGQAVDKLRFTHSRLVAKKYPFYLSKLSNTCTECVNTGKVGK